MLASLSSSDNPQDRLTSIQQLLASLRTPIATLEELRHILLQILTSLGFISGSTSPEPNFRHDDVLHILPTIQHLVLDVVLPTWHMPLQEAGHDSLVTMLFCPPSTAEPGTATTVVISALPILLSHLQTLDPTAPGPATILGWCVSRLEDIFSRYPLDIVHEALFLSSSGIRLDPRRESRRTRDWEEYIRSACSVPGRVANAFQGRAKYGEILEYGVFFSAVCISTEKILFRTSQVTSGESSLQSLILKLLHLGLFPASPPRLPSQPSFFLSTLPTIQRHLHVAGAKINSQYSQTWTALIKSLPLTSQQTFLTSLLGALECCVGRDTSPRARRRVGDAARVLCGVSGKLGESEDEDIWSAVKAVVCGTGRTWDVGVVRAVLYWIADPWESGNAGVDEAALENILHVIVAVWTNPDTIRHSLLSQHRYTTTLLLITLSALPSESPAVRRLALSPPFISSISIYLAHLDVAVRRCGMLTAEVVAERCGQKLHFGGWDGDGEGLEWARDMRAWKPDWTMEGFGGREEVEEPSLPKATETEESPPPAPPTTFPPPSPQLDSDDDSLQGYDSPPSSRAPSPTPSELAEMEADPTVRVGRSKPVARPVYLAQLVELLRTDRNDEQGVAERTEVALECAEGLIRRKSGFGMELEENAVELTIKLVGLRDNYELEGFEEKRQSALNALVECCPRKSAQTLVEQFFTNQYSTTHRFAILTALALGARVLAGLPVPPSSSRVTPGTVAFPSKTLSPALHRKYGEESAVQGLVKGITARAVEDSRKEVEGTIPEVVRERRLRLGSTRPYGRVSEVQVGGVEKPRPQTPTPATTFADVAAEHFIMPLVNHMWLHVRDVETRSQVGKKGAGSGMILDAVVLAQYLGTLAVLVHAARHAPAFLGVVAPGAVELAVTLGSRPLEGGGGDSDGKEAAVLTAALEVSLVALDACIDLDGGRMMGLEQTALLLAVGEWAGGVLVAMDGGRSGRMRGEGGTVEGRVGGAAAGVVMKVEKITDRWGRSMVGF